MWLYVKIRRAHIVLRKDIIRVRGNRNCSVARQVLSALRDRVLCSSIIFHFFSPPTHLPQLELFAHPWLFRFLQSKHGNHSPTLVNLQVSLQHLSRLVSFSIYSLANRPPRRFVDPIFAVFVGLSAATLRIRREQLEKYPTENASPLALWQKGVRMGTSYYQRETAPRK